MSIDEILESLREQYSLMAALFPNIVFWFVLWRALLGREKP